MIGFFYSLMQATKANVCIGLKMTLLNENLQVDVEEAEA